MAGEARRRASDRRRGPGSNLRTDARAPGDGARPGYRGTEADVDSIGAQELMIVMFVGIVLVAALIPMIFYLLTLQRALSRCSPERRAMEPGMVWLMLIPLFNLVWHFFVVSNVAKSLQAEFAKRQIAIDPSPGYSIGLPMCILFACGVIPFLGILASIGGIVCWIMYWVRIAEFSRRLEVEGA